MLYHIPEITQDTIDSSLASILEDESFCYKTLDKIKTENPVLYNMMEILILSGKDEEYVKGYIVGASQFYSLISRQAEANLMDSEYGI